METWSDSPIHPNFTVKLFVDTMILVYLVDDTYQSLTDFVDLAKDSKFIDLVSSKYVIFEFTGVRKREHYFRKVVAASKLSAKGEVNFNSLIKYQNKFEAPEVSFDAIIGDIKADVEAELLDISSNYRINYNYSTLHDDQLHPTSQVCLSTKIANQDSLVLVSGVMPQPGITSDDLQILTNDSDFAKFYTESAVQLDALFTGYKVQKPKLLELSSIMTGVNLTKPISRANIEEHLRNLVLKVIQEKNKSNFIGTTIQPSSASFPADIVPFKFVLNKPVPENFFITILSKNLDFIYTTKKKVEQLHHNGNPVVKGHTFTNKADNNVAFKVADIDISTRAEIAVPAAIINRLREKGNFVFIHPDS